MSKKKKNEVASVFFYEKGMYHNGNKNTIYREKKRGVKCLSSYAIVFPITKVIHTYWTKKKKVTINQSLLIWGMFL